MKSINSETGAVIMLMALLSFVVMILIAIAFDVWSFESDTIRLQMASDAGTLSAGTLITNNIENSEITAIAIRLAAERNRFNNRATDDPAVNPYADPALPLPTLETMLDTAMRDIMTSEGIPTTAHDACMSLINSQTLTVPFSALVPIIQTAISHNSCISDALKGEIRVSLLKEVGEAVAKDTLLVSNFSADEIDDVTLMAKDASGDETNSPALIQQLSININAQSEVYLADHVIGLSTEDHIPRNKNSAGQKIYAAIMLVLDVSGSMGSSMTDLKDAAINFTAKFAKTDNALGIVSFANIGQVLRPLQLNFTQTDYETAINSLIADGWTNLDDALYHAQNEIWKPIADDMLKVVIVITDGNPNGIAGQSGKEKWGGITENNPICRADNLRDDGATVYTIGFGTVNHNFLRRVAFCTEEPAPDCDPANNKGDNCTCSGAGIDGNPVKTFAQLVKNKGKHYESPSANELDVLLQAIAGQIKFRLTQ